MADLIESSGPLTEAALEDVIYEILKFHDLPDKYYAEKYGFFDSSA